MVSCQLVPLSTERGLGPPRLAPFAVAQAPTARTGSPRQSPPDGRVCKGPVSLGSRLRLHGRMMRFTQPSPHRFKDFVYTYRIFREKNGYYHMQVRAHRPLGEAEATPRLPPAERRRLNGGGCRAELASHDDGGTGCGPVCVTKVAGTCSPGSSAAGCTYLGSRYDRC